MTDDLALLEGPRLDRKVTLQFRGDWGQANITRICGWIAQEIGDRSAPGSRFAIWSGTGGRDQTDALMAGEIDITVMTPTAAVGLVRNGSGPIGVPPQPELRSLGVIGQRDSLVVAVDAALPVRSVADLVKVADQLVIATAPEDGINLIGLAAHHGLRLAGVDPDALTAAGGRFMYSERAFPVIHEFAEGNANVLIQEAVMTPAWQRIADNRPVRYLDWGDAVFDGFAELGWKDTTVKAGYLPELSRDLRTLDFSDFAVLCRADLPDDIAYMAAWCMIKTRRALEAQYAHIPVAHSPVTYPLDPGAMSKTPVPLHPAAEQAYRDLAEDTAIVDALMWG